MKILMLGKWPIDDVSGGVANHVYNLVNSLSEFEQINLRFLSFSTIDKEIHLKNSTIKNIKVKNIDLICPLLLLLKINKEINNFKPDILHLQGSNFSPYFLYIRLFSFRAKKIVTIHGIVHKEARFKRGKKFIIFNFLNKYSEKYIFKKIQNIITVSAAATKLIQNNSNARVVTIPNGINFKEIAKFSPDPNIITPSLFFLGELRPEKGIELIIRSLVSVKKVFPNIHLYIGGTGIMEKELKDLTRELNIQDNVEFLGFLKGEKYTYYKSTDIYILPSYWENQPISILEAMASGTAIIASNVGGIPELIENGRTGFLFENNDISDLTQKIIILLSDEKFRKYLGTNAKDKSRNYSWDIIALKTYETYKDIIQ